MLRWIALLVTVALTATSHSQSYRRFELGVQTTMLDAASTTSCGSCSAAQWTIGPEFVFNLNQHLALDAMASVAPTHAPGLEIFPELYRGRLTEALGGVKASIRAPRFTLFAKARPGIATWGHVLQKTEYVNFPPASLSDIKFVFARKNVFALNLGGGIEYALSPRLTLSAELGDTLIHPAYGFLRFNNNVQAGLGAFYQFGNLRVAEMPHTTAHRFFDRWNIALMSLSLLAQSADAITTQRSLANCRRTNPFPDDPTICDNGERDPIARPFVKHGWGGQVGLGAIVNSTELLVMYAVHRMGYHGVERAIPAPLIVFSSIEASHNVR